MAARIDDGRAQLLTRTGLDWTDKYPAAIAALANVNVKTAEDWIDDCGPAVWIAPSPNSTSLPSSIA